MNIKAEEPSTIASTKPSGVNNPRPSSVKSADCPLGIEIDSMPMLDQEATCAKSGKCLPVEEGPWDLTSPS
jgi:hypothetical protein